MDELSALLAQWSEGFAARNSDALAALYCEDALLYGSSPELVCGREAIRDHFRRVPGAGARGRGRAHARVPLAEDGVRQNGDVAGGPWA